MLAKLGHKVMSLTRIAIGPITLKGLPVGECRPLTRHEVELLRKVASGVSVSVPGFADDRAARTDRGPGRGRHGERPARARHGDDEAPRGRHGDHQGERPQPRPRASTGPGARAGSPTGCRPPRRPAAACGRSTPPPPSRCRCAPPAPGPAGPPSAGGPKRGPAGTSSGAGVVQPGSHGPQPAARGPRRPAGPAPPAKRPPARPVEAPSPKRDEEPTPRRRIIGLGGPAASERRRAVRRPETPHGPQATATAIGPGSAARPVAPPRPKDDQDDEQ